MQSVSSRIWTRIAVFISYGDNDYTKVNLSGEQLIWILKREILLSIITNGRWPEFESWQHLIIRGNSDTYFDKQIIDDWKNTIFKHASFLSVLFVSVLWKDFSRLMFLCSQIINTVDASLTNPLANYSNYEIVHVKTIDCFFNRFLALRKRLH